MTEEMMPIEKAEKYGIDKLSVSELLAIVLRVGQPGVPITEMTRELMRQNGDKLKNLERRSRAELMETPGIGPVKAFQIEAVLEIMRRYNIETLGDKFVIRTSRDIAAYMRPRASALNHECIWIITLDRRNGVIDCKEMSSGGSSATVFDTKMVLKSILATPRAEGVVMVHNHPSGSLQPSPQDNDITQRLKEGCKFLGFKMLDHVIVTQDGHYSYADEGKL